MTAWLGFLALLLLTTPARADIGFPPGFTSEVYVTGQGFDTSGERGVSGIPSVGTLGLDAAGTLYMSRTGARFRVGDVEDLSAIYRIPVGGARLTPDNQNRYLYGPPLPNPQIGAVAARGPVWVTTYDRERRLGALYRFLDGKPVLFAGGRPAPGAEPVLRHPEGVVIDSTGDLYVTDREEGAIVRLDARGNLVNRRHATVVRPRILTMDEAGNLWVGGDGTAETPFGAGNGEILRVTPDGRVQSVLQGPLPAGFSQSPGGALFVVQRRTGQVFAAHTRRPPPRLRHHPQRQLPPGPRVRPGHAGDPQGRDRGRSPPRPRLALPVAAQRGDPCLRAVRRVGAVRRPADPRPDGVRGPVLWRGAPARSRGGRLAQIDSSTGPGRNCPRCAEHS